MEILVVDADARNKTDVTDIMGSYPDVTFLPFFGKPSYLEMLRHAIPSIKGGYCLILNIDLDLPKASVELMLNDMRNTPALKIMTVQLFQQGHFMRGYAPAYFPWIVVPHKAQPSESIIPVLTQGISGEFLYMITTSSLKEMTTDRAFNSEWGLFYWQLKYGAKLNLIGIATNITAKLRGSATPKPTPLPATLKEGFRIIDLSIMPPYRWLYYIIFTITYIANKSISIFSLLTKIKLKKHQISTT